MKALAGGLLGTVCTVALLAPWIAPHLPREQFREFLMAPPMAIRILDANGRFHAPFVYPLRLVDPPERRYEEDRSRRIAIAWFAHGKILSAGDWEEAVFLLGTDSLGRDTFSRLVFGARASLGVALTATIGAILIGAVVGGVAGFAGGLIDETAMRIAEFVLVLPAVYVMLALRAALPLVLAPSLVFALMTVLLAVSGWPFVARAVREIVAVEHRREYVEAARAVGAGRLRVLWRHLMPSAAGVTATQGVLLLPMFIAAETTLSFVGVGFAEPSPSWGVMLQEAANVRVITQAPWLLAPAAAIVLVVSALTILGHARPRVVF